MPHEVGHHHHGSVVHNIAAAVGGTAARAVVDHVRKRVREHFTDEPRVRVQEAEEPHDMETRFNHGGVVVAKKHKPSKKKKRQIKFAKKVHEAEEEPKVVNVYRSKQFQSAGTAITNGVSDQQSIWGNNFTSGGRSLSLAAQNATEAAVPNIFAIITAKGGAALPNASVVNNTKFLITHNEHIYHIYNASNIGAVITVYRFVAATDISELGFSTPADTWANLTAVQQQPTTAGFTAAFGVNRSYNSPFDCSGIGKYWKFLDKEEMLLEPTNAVKYVMRGRKGLIDQKDWELAPQTKYAKKGRTQGIIITWNGPTQLNTASIVLQVHASSITHYKTIVGVSVNDVAGVSFGCTV